MKSILISTSSLWNCGDDFIREGIINLLNFKENINIIWWNRGYGISNSYANDLNVNLPLMSYFVVAGTPQWVYKNVRIYKYCLKHDIPFSLIGVGTKNLYKYHLNLLKKLARANLCEIALARDKMALEAFKDIGFKNIGLISDPAFFMKPIQNDRKDLNIIGWRKQFWPESADYSIIFYLKYYKSLIKKIKYYLLFEKLTNQKKREEYNNFFKYIFDEMDSPKLVVVHDNREIKEAEKLFGEGNVFYSTDYWKIFEIYSRSKTYIGSRIHGAIPSLIHGTPICLIYTSNKASVIETSKEIFEKHNTKIENMIKVKYWKKNDSNGIKYNDMGFNKVCKVKLNEAINIERDRIRNILKCQKELSNYIKS